MGHIPEDENYEEFMDASAEEWSQPSEPEPRPAVEPEPTDRWGSPVAQESTASDENRWGSEPIEKTRRDNKPKKSGRTWWIIAIIVVVVLCLCGCLTLTVLSIFGIIEWNTILGFSPAPIELAFHIL